METNPKENIHLLVEITGKYIDISNDGNIYQTITDDLLKLSGAAYTVINVYNEGKGTTTTKSISGLQSNLRKAAQLFGFEIEGKEWDDIEDKKTRVALASKSLIKGGNIASYSKHVTPTIGKALNTLFNVGDIYSIGVYKKNKYFGNLQMIMFNNRKVGRGEYIEIFAGAVGNLLYRFQSESLLLEARNQLIIEKINLKAITRSLDESSIVSITDTSGMIIKANAKFCEISKYSEQELLGKNHNIINSGYHPKAFWSEMWHTIKSGKTWRAEVKNRAKDGSKYWVDTIINPILDAEGKIIQYLSIRNLITDRKKYELEILDSREQALVGKRAKEVFFTNMNHELRTPLNALVGFSSLLAKTELTALQADYLRSINVAGDLLLNTINQILNLSKIESGNINLNVVPIDSHKLLNEICNLFYQKTLEKQLNFVFSFSKDFPRWVLIDKTSITQILLNLVSNAVKFTDKGSIEFLMNVVSIKDNVALLEFKIIDTGIGVSKSMHEKIFERFTQENENTGRDYGGSGLGLTIVKKLVELLNGSISIESEKGKGSEFTLQIPVEICPPVEQEAQKPTRQKLISVVPRVLLVEDNLLNQKLISDILKQYKVLVEITDNGKNAIDLIKMHAYDIILMDIQMPVMDGSIATKHIRNILKINTPIVAITANPSQMEQERLLALGMNGFLSKPFRENELIELFETLNFLLEPLSDSEVLPRNFKGINNNFPPDEQKTLTKLVDLSYLKSSSNSSIREVLEIFLLETPDDLRLILEKARMKNDIEVKRLAHKMKSSFSFIGAQRGFELCLKIEGANDFKKVEMLIAELMELTREILNALKPLYK